MAQNFNLQSIGGGSSNDKEPEPKQNFLETVEDVVGLMRALFLGEWAHYM